MVVNNREKALKHGTKGRLMAYIDSPRGADWQEYYVGKIRAGRDSGSELGETGWVPSGNVPVPVSSVCERVVTTASFRVGLYTAIVVIFDVVVVAVFCPL